MIGDRVSSRRYTNPNADYKALGENRVLIGQYAFPSPGTLDGGVIRRMSRKTTK
ncbi:hypothetical protein GCM10025794_34320 [Massilia kyonggiensis]